MSRSSGAGQRRPLPTKPPVERAAGSRILLVEAHAGLRNLVGGYLREEGYTVIEAADLTDASAVLSSDKVDLVLTDAFRVGTAELGTSRWTSLSHIRSLAGDTPVVICTLYPEADFATYREQGFQGLLHKPFSPAELLAMVRRHLGPSR